MAHLSLVNEELSSELARSFKRIELLERKIAHLENQFAAIEESLDGPIENTKPPHW